MIADLFNEMKDDVMKEKISKLLEGLPLGDTNGERHAVGFDLDKTIIFSSRSLMLGSNHHEPLTIVENNHGRPLSYMTEASHAMLSIMPRYAEVFPVTARSQKQMRRVELPWGAPQNYVCLSGATVCHNGVEDLEWEDFVRTRVAESAISLAEVERLTEEYQNMPWVLSRENFGHMFDSTTLDIQNVPDWFIPEIEQKLEGSGYYASLQGRKLYITPNMLSKGDAFLHLVKKLEITGRTYAAGDSLMDVDLLEKADFAFHPSHGEMVSQHAAPPHSIQSLAQGVLGGEEIVARILAQVST